MLLSRKPVYVEARNLIDTDMRRSLASDQYRTLRTNINFSFVDKEIRSIAVTSASSSEGKSTTAANLAIVYAQEGKRVLLLDGDLRKPTMHQTFSLDNSVGLSTVLIRKNSFESAIKSTEIEHLNVLTSGPLPPNPVELLGSAAMEALINQLVEKYDLLIIDSPPILTMADGQILANRCEGSLLVINSGKTVKEEAMRAKEAIIASNSKLIGAVLNNFKLPINNSYRLYEEIK